MINKEDVMNRLTVIIADNLGIRESQITPEANFIEDLGVDSLDTVELVMAVEEEFSLEIPDEHAEKLETVGKAADYIYEHAE